MTQQTEALKLALEALQVATTPLAKDRQEVLRAITAIKEALAQPEQEPVTLMNNLALTTASDAAFRRFARELVWNLSEKVMGVAMSAESVKGRSKRVQVTAEAMSDLRRFVEKEVTAKLVFWDKLFDRHKASWKLNAAPQPPQRDSSATPRAWVGLTDGDKSKPDVGKWIELSDEWVDGYTAGLEYAEAKLKEKNT